MKKKIENIKISDIDLSKMSPEDSKPNRGVYTRSVYRDDANNRFVKIWEPNYFYKRNFERASEGFLRGISLLEGIVIGKDGRCLGYTTTIGTPISHANINRHKLNDLIERVAVASKRYSTVYIDFVISNIVDLNDKYYIVDLEPCVLESEVKTFPGIQSILEYNDYGYRKAIATMLGPLWDPKIRTVRQHTKSDKEINYGTANGRLYLEHEYLPSLDGSILFVGVNYYTDFYHRLVKSPEMFETVDVSETVIEHGSPHVHHIGDIRDFAGKRYDNVVFFGILGHDDDWDIIKDEGGIDRCFAALDALVKPGGTLLLGPATVTRPKEFWDAAYDGLTGYENVSRRKIDINYIWIGRKAK